jgi:hypothetical protein
MSENAPDNSENAIINIDVNPISLNLTQQVTSNNSNDSKRVIKFRFKRDMRELVGLIHTSNKPIFPIANKRNQFGDPIDYPASSTP